MRDYTEGSEMQKLYLDSVKNLFGIDAKIIGIHAGLECGLAQRLRKTTWT